MTFFNQTIMSYCHLGALSHQKVALHSNLSVYSVPYYQITGLDTRAATAVRTTVAVYCFMNIALFGSGLFYPVNRSKRSFSRDRLGQGSSQARSCAGGVRHGISLPDIAGPCRTRRPPRERGCARGTARRSGRAGRPFRLSPQARYIPCRRDWRARPSRDRQRR